MTQICFQKGFGLRGEVRPVLAESYYSPLVARLKALDYDINSSNARALASMCAARVPTFHIESALAVRGHSAADLLIGAPAAAVAI